MLFDCFAVELAQAQERLPVFSADGNHKASTLGELFDERWRHARRGGSDKDGAERRECRPAKRAVADFDADIEVSESGEPFPRGGRERRARLDGDDFARKFGEYGGLIAGASADFKDAFRAS